jgi:hypothetical protein
LECLGVNERCTEGCPSEGGKVRGLLIRVRIQVLGGLQYSKCRTTENVNA